MRGRILAAVLLAAAASCSDSDPDGLSDAEHARLLDACLASAEQPAGCAGWVAEAVTRLEAEGCGYDQIADAISHGLTPRHERTEDWQLDCEGP